MYPADKPFRVRVDRHEGVGARTATFDRALAAGGLRFRKPKRLGDLAVGAPVCEAPSTYAAFRQVPNGKAESGVTVRWTS